MKKRVDEILKSVIHEELGNNILDAGMVESVAMSDDRIAVTIVFEKSRDPFTIPIKREIKEKLEAAFPDMVDKISVLIKEGAANRRKLQEEKKTTTKFIKKVIAVASGKGGVGKSTVTANLASTLAEMGYRVGIMDADIYGPSQAKMFGVEDYHPVMHEIDGIEQIVPAMSRGIKVMSIGFFIETNDALIWRGPMATSAIKQMIHQTEWGELDYLLIDLPPGTGDIHLTVIDEIRIDGTVIVSTPQQIAVADVIRGVSMFKSSKINIPILGIIENMAWFTPEELPNNRYYIFGKGGAAEYAKKEGIELIGEIPIIQSVMEGADSGVPGVGLSEVAKVHYISTAEKIVDKLQ